MTMLDKKCDVCHINEPIGVVSTSLPLSVAICRRCAEEGAGPESVFEYLRECDYKPAEIRPELVTFKDGKYITYAQWYASVSKVELRDGG